jgi:hypothetical protein
MRNSFLALLAFVIVCAPAAAAQARTRPAIADSSARRIMARVGSETGAVWFRDLLRQADGAQPRAKLDELADSLTTRALDPGSARRDSEAYVRAVNASLALMDAGTSRARGGRPYPGAFDRLVTVHRQARSLYVRRTALIGMLVTSHSRAVDYLRRVAESSDSTAVDAVELLTMDADGGSSAAITPTAAERQESVSALKALASGRRVEEPEAANSLAIWIQRYRSEHPSGDSL